MEGKTSMKNYNLMWLALANKVITWNVMQRRAWE
jgi:hypothetical protein